MIRRPREVLAKTSYRMMLVISCVWLSFWFVLIYGMADYITSQRANHLRIHFDWELDLPFIPELSIVYSSLYGLFACVAWTADTNEKLLQFVGRMTLLTLVAGTCFLLLPFKLAFPVAEVHGWASIPFSVADRINLNYNLAPSLHVGYAVLAAETVRQSTESVWIVPVLQIWCLAIALSAWFTHQHHLMDLFTGYLFGFVAAKFSCKSLG